MDQPGRKGYSSGMEKWITMICCYNLNNLLIVLHGTSQIDATLAVKWNLLLNNLDYLHTDFLTVRYRDSSIPLSYFKYISVVKVQPSIVYIPLSLSKKK